MSKKRGVIMFKKILVAILILNSLGYINYEDEVEYDDYRPSVYIQDREDSDL